MFAAAREPIAFMVPLLWLGLHLIDRLSVAHELGFDGVCENSLDAVSDRDFAIEFTAAAAILMMHISRFAEELIL